MSPNVAAQIQTGGATVGDTVKVRMQSGATRDFTLASQQDAAPEKGRISNTSPIGQALLGCKAGERRQYQAGDRTLEMEVLDVSKQAST